MELDTPTSKGAIRGASDAGGWNGQLRTLASGGSTVGVWSKPDATPQ